MNKKLSVAGFFVLLAVVCLSFCGCAKKITEESKMETVDAFLTEFFCFNHLQRYDIYLETLQNAEDIETHEKASQEYYQPFLSMSTENCINGMQRNRLPLKYDSLIVSNGITVEIQEIQCDPVNENTYAFEVSFEPSEIDDVLSTPVKGRITIETIDKVVYIDSITMY